MSSGVISLPQLIGAEIYRGSSYGRTHPLAIPRVSAALDLIRLQGWHDDARYHTAPLASVQDLARYHEPAYIAAVQRAEATQRVSEEERQRFNIGCNGNPLYPEMFRRPATGCGASLLGADLLLQGYRTIFTPAGGTHHGLPARASGFCYFNDPVLAILRLLDRGISRVLYIDLDAHHGDGVELAFAQDPRVMVISIHEAGRWPFTGRVEDRGCGNVINLPVPAGFHDDELAFLLDSVVLPRGSWFDAEILVLQCGVDGLADDPLSKLSLSNRAIWAAVQALLPLAPRRLVLGGGGYNPWSVARAWAGIWAVIDGQNLPNRLTEEAEAMLRTIEWRHSRGRHPPDHWFTCLADPGQTGLIRDEVRALPRLIG